MQTKPHQAQTDTLGLRHLAMRASPNLLLVSDEPNHEVLCEVVRECGFSVQHQRVGAAAISQCIELRPDCIVLDWRSRALAPLQLVRSLRSIETTRTIPLLVLTSAQDQELNWQALEAGADECMADPIQPRELMVRFAILTRRREDARTGTLLIYADVELDVERHKVRRGGRPIKVTPNQLRLLRHFMENPTVVYSRRQLSEAIWNDPDVDEGTITQCIVRLRRALNCVDGPELIRSVRNIGYALDDNW